VRGNLLSSSIPGFASKIAPLRQLLELCLASASTHSKKFASRLWLSENGWQSEHSKSFLTVVDSIKHAVILTYLSDDLVPCLFTDASKNSRMIVITQAPLQDLHLVLKEQAHGPLASVLEPLRILLPTGQFLKRKLIPFIMLFDVSTIFYAPGNIRFESLQITEP
jgi:hypothetical protein